MPVPSESASSAPVATTSAITTAPSPVASSAAPIAAAMASGVSVAASASVVAAVMAAVMARVACAVTGGACTFTAVASHATVVPAAAAGRTGAAWTARGEDDQGDYTQHDQHPDENLQWRILLCCPSLSETRQERRSCGSPADDLPHGVGRATQNQFGPGGVGRDEF